MHRIAIWASAGVLALSATTALAQDNNQSGDQKAQVTEQNATNAGAATMTYDDLVSYLNSGAVPDAASAPMAGADLQSITPDATITVVPVSTLEGYKDESTDLKDAATKYGQALSDMRAQIAARQDLVDKLKANGATAEQVLAITTSGDGSYTIYVDDTADAGGAAATSATTTTTTTTAQ